MRPRTHLSSSSDTSAHGSASGGTGGVRRSRHDWWRHVSLATAVLLSIVAPGCGDMADEGATSEVGAALSTLEPTRSTGTIDAQFQVAPSGAASYQIPILVPPGTKGVEPQLSISYSSTGGNGTLGMGMSLSGLSMITRCPRTMAYDGVRGAVNGDMNDRFCLDGQRLVVINDRTYGSDGSEYRTELETRTRIFARGTCGQGPCRFEVIDKSGNKLDLGWTGNSKTYVADGLTPNAYGLSKLTDLHGNYMTVDYFVDQNQLYPQQILYTKNDAEPLLSPRKVEFTYENRGDADFVFVAGAKIATGKRLSKISTFVDDGLFTLVREYRLGYVTSAATSRSLLDNIRECDAVNVCLPATKFDYNDAKGTDFEIVKPTQTGPDGTDIYQSWLRHDHGAFILPGDFNGDGKTDFIRQTHGDWDNDLSYSFEVYFSRGDGYFDMVEPAGGYYQDWLRFDPGVNIIPGDYNGDGKTDFIRQEKGGWDGPSNTFNVYFSRGDGYFDIVTPSAAAANGENIYQHWLRFDPGASIIPGDYNGDGKTDFLRQEKGGWDNDTNNSFNVYFSRGDGYFDVVTPAGAEYQTNLRADPGVNIIPGDFNGDGMMDFARQEKNGLDDDTNSSFQIYFSKGDGTFDIVANPTDDTGWNFQEMNRFEPGCNLFPADFNGDGKTDYLRQEKAGKANDTDGTLQIHFSRGNGTFERRGLGGTMGTWKGEWTNLMPVDFDGDGRMDILKQEKGPADDTISDSFEMTIRKSTSEEQILPGANVAGDPYQDQLRFDHGVNIIPGDFNGDGKIDFIRQEKGGWDNDVVNTFAVYFAKGDKNVDSLKSIENGLGGKVDIQYAPLTDSSVYTKGTNAPAGLVESQSAMYVVQSYQETPSAGVVYDYEYHYTGLRNATDGRGSAGFASIERTAGDVVTTY